MAAAATNPVRCGNGLRTPLFVRPGRCTSAWNMISSVVARAISAVRAPVAPLGSGWRQRERDASGPSELRSSVGSRPVGRTRGDGPTRLRRPQAPRPADADRDPSLFSVGVCPMMTRSSTGLKALAWKRTDIGDCVVAEFRYRVSSQETPEQNGAVRCSGTVPPPPVAYGAALCGSASRVVMESSLQWATRTTLCLRRLPAVMDAFFLVASKLPKQRADGCDVGACFPIAKLNSPW